MSDDTWLVMGLGNPGSEYANTRHSVGHAVVAELARRCGTTFRNHKTGAQLAEGRVGPGDPKLILAVSNGYMNESGRPAAALLKFFSLPPEHLIVVHDELDIPFGTLRLKNGGGHGGHNGVRDIAAALSTPNFARVRVGIGRPPGRQGAAEYVLKPFAKHERDTLAITVVEAADAVELLTEQGLEAAQLKYHTAFS